MVSCDIDIEKSFRKESEYPFIISLILTQVEFFLHSEKDGEQPIEIAVYGLLSRYEHVEVMSGCLLHIGNEVRIIVWVFLLQDFTGLIQGFLLMGVTVVMVIGFDEIVAFLRKNEIDL